MLARPALKTVAYAVAADDLIASAECRARPSGRADAKNGAVTGRLRFPFQDDRTRAAPLSE